VAKVKSISAARDKSTEKPGEEHETARSEIRIFV